MLFRPGILSALLLVTASAYFLDAPIVQFQQSIGRPTQQHNGIVHADDRIWVTSSDGSLTILRPSTPNRAWVYLPDDSTNGGLISGESSVVFTRQGWAVYAVRDYDENRVSGTSRVVAVDKFGQLQWKVTVPALVVGTPVVLSSDRVYVPHNVMSSDGSSTWLGGCSVVTLTENKTAGTVTAEITATLPRSDTIGPVGPATGRTISMDSGNSTMDVVYFGEANDNGQSGTGALYVVLPSSDGYDLRVVSTLPASTVTAPAVARDGVSVYMATQASSIFSWTDQSGVQSVLDGTDSDLAPSWVRILNRNNQDPIPSPPILSSDSSSLYVSDGDGIMYAVLLENNEVGWQDASASSPQLARPVLSETESGTALYSIEKSGAVVRSYAVDSGSISWSFGCAELTGTSNCTASVEADFAVSDAGNTLFYADTDGNIIGLHVAAFDTPAPTQEPTSMPTDAPSSSPTAAPTSSPIEKPLAAPVADSVSLPTAAPQDSPALPPQDEGTTGGTDDNIPGNGTTVGTPVGAESLRDKSQSFFKQDDIVLILGAAAGGLALAVVAAFLCLRRKKKKEPSQVEHAQRAVLDAWEKKDDTMKQREFEKEYREAEEEILTHLASGTASIASGDYEEDHSEARPKDDSPCKSASSLTKGSLDNLASIEEGASEDEKSIKSQKSQKSLTTAITSNTNKDAGVEIPLEDIDATRYPARSLLATFQAALSPVHKYMAGYGSDVAESPVRSDPPELSSPPESTATPQATPKALLPADNEPWSPESVVPPPPPPCLPTLQPTSPTHSKPDPEATASPMRSPQRSQHLSPQRHQSKPVPQGSPLKSPQSQNETPEETNDPITSSYVASSAVNPKSPKDDCSLDESLYIEGSTIASLGLKSWAMSEIEAAQPMDEDPTPSPKPKSIYMQYRPAAQQHNQEDPSMPPPPPPLPKPPKVTKTWSNYVAPAIKEEAENNESEQAMQEQQARALVLGSQYSRPTPIDADSKAAAPTESPKPATRPKSTGRVRAGLFSRMSERVLDKKEKADRVDTTPSPVKSRKTLSDEASWSPRGLRTATSPPGRKLDLNSPKPASNAGGIIDEDGPRTRRVAPSASRTHLSKPAVAQPLSPPTSKMLKKRPDPKPVDSGLDPWNSFLNELSRVEQQFFNPSLPTRSSSMNDVQPSTAATPLTTRAAASQSTTRRQFSSSDEEYTSTDRDTTDDDEDSNVATVPPSVF